MAAKTLETSVSEFADALSLLVRRVRAAAASHDLSWSETSVMGRLAREGPATAADLARSQGMKPQSMGTIIAALEEMGFVERKPHPTDGRQVNIRLTPKGAAIHKNARDAKRMWFANAVSKLDEHERQTLFAAGDIIQRLVENDHQ